MVPQSKRKYNSPLAEDQQSWHIGPVSLILSSKVASEDDLDHYIYAVWSSWVCQVFSEKPFQMDPLGEYVRDVCKSKFT